MVTLKGFYYKKSKRVRCLMEMKGVIANLIWSCLKLQQPECPEWKLDKLPFRGSLVDAYLLDCYLVLAHVFGTE